VKEANHSIHQYGRCWALPFINLWGRQTPYKSMHKQLAYPAWDLIVDGPGMKTESIMLSILAAHFPLHASNPRCPPKIYWYI
jgi:hypothetical protein